MLRSRLMLGWVLPVAERLLRLLGTPVPEDPASVDVFRYKGPILVEPTDDFWPGKVVVDVDKNLADYLYSKMPVPADAQGMHVGLYGRITLEVLPDPAMHRWPMNDHH